MKWYKSLRNKLKKAHQFLESIQNTMPTLFASWKHGYWLTGLKLTKVA
jgi:hypothetical protein